MRILSLRTIVSFLALMSALSDLALCQTCKPPPAGMINWWTGDGTAMDRLGNNNGSLQNGATFAPGLAGLAFQLNVSGPNPLACPTCAYEALDNTSAGSLNAVTLEGWVYPRSSQNGWIYTRFNSGQPPGGSGPELGVTLM
jgi:hypothetical protein